jgi:hypothetical protein
VGKVLKKLNPEASFHILDEKKEKGLGQPGMDGLQKKG